MLGDGVAEILLPGFPGLIEAVLEGEIAIDFGQGGLEGLLHTGGVVVDAEWGGLAAAAEDMLLVLQRASHLRFGVSWAGARGGDGGGGCGGSSLELLSMFQGDTIDAFVARSDAALASRMSLAASDLGLCTCIT